MNNPGESEPSSPGMHEASRREKLRRLEELGIDPWGAPRRRDADCQHSPREGEITVVPIPPGSEQRSPEQHGPKVRAAGRIVLQRKKGKLIFLDIRDSSGQIQLFVGRGKWARTTGRWRNASTWAIW